MIERYSRPAMAALFDDAARYRTWLEVEIAAAEAMERKGDVPRGATARIRDRARVDAKRVDELERTLRHDVIAFLTQVGETVGEDARHLHLGMTSSDLVDTALALTLVRATELLTREVEGLRQAARDLAVRTRDLPMVGRTHGIHAEPITFGLKMAGWYAELLRDLRRLRAAHEQIAVAKLSGAVGTYATSSPDIEAEVLAKMKDRVGPDGLASGRDPKASLRRLNASTTAREKKRDA